MALPLAFQRLIIVEFLDGQILQNIHGLSVQSVYYIVAFCGRIKKLHGVLIAKRGIVFNDICETDLEVFFLNQGS